MPVSLHIADLAIEFSAAFEAVLAFLRDGGVFMAFLIVLSLLTVAVILYKAIALRVDNIAPLRVQKALAKAKHTVP